MPACVEDLHSVVGPLPLLCIRLCHARLLLLRSYHFSVVLIICLPLVVDGID